jgi:putative PIN family toxin of toxin-antitoxin system
MGKKQKEIKRVVLDTNVIISGLLFKGELSRIVSLWKTGEIIPIVSEETFDELRTALLYPKFSLSPEETRTLIQNEILSFFEVVNVVETVERVCRDPGNDKFISCAISARAEYIVTGDRNLSDLNQYQSIKIIKARNFLKMFVKPTIE